jgi:hypothetical protein
MNGKQARLSLAGAVYEFKPAGTSINVGLLAMRSNLSFLQLRCRSPYCAVPEKLGYFLIWR